ncbi:hypothetical protein F4810DRAFT_715749 [Camillea tinctor]|nr:hypothetical protein F4810DRAFT_715749 [Camillea tinctor]
MYRRTHVGDVSAYGIRRSAEVNANTAQANFSMAQQQSILAIDNPELYKRNMDVARRNVEVTQAQLAAVRQHVDPPAYIDPSGLREFHRQNINLASQLHQDASQIHMEARIASMDIHAKRRDILREIKLKIAELEQSFPEPPKYPQAVGPSQVAGPSQAAAFPVPMRSLQAGSFRPAGTTQFSQPAQVAWNENADNDLAMFAPLCGKVDVDIINDYPALHKAMCDKGWKFSIADIQLRWKNVIFPKIAAARLSAQAARDRAKRNHDDDSDDDDIYYYRRQAMANPLTRDTFPLEPLPAKDRNADADDDGYRLPATTYNPHQDDEASRRPLESGDQPKNTPATLPEPKQSSSSHRAKDPSDVDHLLTDDEAAAIIKQIDEQRAKGFGRPFSSVYPPPGFRSQLAATRSANSNASICGSCSNHDVDIKGDISIVLDIDQEEEVNSKDKGKAKAQVNHRQAEEDEARVIRACMAQYPPMTPMQVQNAMTLAKARFNQQRQAAKDQAKANKKQQLDAAKMAQHPPVTTTDAQNAMTMSKARFNQQRDQQRKEAKEKYTKMKVSNLSDESSFGSCGDGEAEGADDAEIKEAKIKDAENEGAEDKDNKNEDGEMEQN